MKSAVLVLLVSAIGFGGTVKSQKLSLSEVSLKHSIITYSPTNLSEQDFMKLAPGSEILGRDYTGFDNYSNNGSVASGIIGELNFKIQGKEESRFTRYFSIGTYYNSYHQVGVSYYQRDLTVLDSYDGQRDLGVVTLDSVFTSHIYANYSSQQVGLVMGHHWRTKSDARLKFQLGLVSSMGFLVNGETRVQSNNRYGYKYGLPNSGGYSMDMNSIENDSEVHESKTAVDVAFGTPISLSFQLSKKQKNLKLVHLFAETQLGYGFTMHPELSTFHQARIQNSIGVRLALE